MLPLKLVLKGLYSYQKEQIIDFTRLTEGKLFGIFGSVGSGKSSILEAISYALYGETERLNKHDHRSYNMMNLKCGELYIDFVFLAGKPEKEYRCLVTCKRHKTLFEKVPSLERKAYEKVDDTWIPIELVVIPEVVGLSYQNFRRTIIIPQGKFSEFLQLGDKDRTDMLKEIFHLEKFEYSEQVSVLEKKNSESIKVIEGKLEQLGAVDQQQIEDKQIVLKELLQDIKNQKEVFEKKLLEEKKLAELKEVFTKLSQISDELDGLQKQIDFFQKLDKDISDYEKCLIDFKPLFDLKRENEQNLESSELSLERLKVEAGKQKKLLLSEEAEFDVLIKEYQEKEALKTRADDLNKVIKVQLLQKDVETTSERIQKGQTVIAEVERQLRIFQEKRDAVRASIIENKNQLPDLSVLNQIANWFTVNNGIQENIRKHKRAIDDIEKIIQDNARLHLNGAVRIKNLLKEEGKSEVEVGFLTLKKSELLEEQDRISLKIEHLSVERRLEHFVAQLKENEACPLCGSTHHPEVLSIEDVSNQLENLKSRKSEIGETTKEVDHWILKEKERLLKIESFKNPLEKERDQLRKEEEKLKAHQENFVWTYYNLFSEDQVLEQIKLGNSLGDQMKGLEESLEKLHKDYELEQGKKEKYTKALHQFNIELSSKIAEQKLLKSQIDESTLMAFIHKDSKELQKEAEKALFRYQYVTEKFEKLSEFINKSKQELARVDGQIEEKEKSMETLKQVRLRNNILIDEVLSKSTFSSIDQIRGILSKRIDAEQEKKRVREFDEKLLFKKRQKEDLLNQISGKQYDAEQHKNLLIEIDRQKETITLADKESGRLAGEIAQLENDLREKIKLNVELEKLNLRREDINVMKQLFKGSGFVNYVSSVFLKNLCNSANERFYKLTRQKLRLELTETNNFQVRDFLNNGQVRSVKTLSGGQTFQASLSLALALAESIQQQNKARQNFFFLDEGFGSQDKESLSIVFETLKSLQGENRIVGVISHVSDLQEEIDVFLNVTNDEEEGSLVKGSWEAGG